VDTVPRAHGSDLTATGRLGHRALRSWSWATGGERVIEPGLYPFSSCWPPGRGWPNCWLEVTQVHGRALPPDPRWGLGTREQAKSRLQSQKGQHLSCFSRKPLGLTMLDYPCGDP